MTLHRSVLLDEAIECLNVRPNHTYIDCTFGGGGHTIAILEKNGPNGRVLALDLDSEALNRGQELARGQKGRLVVEYGNFRDVTVVARRQKFDSVDGVLYDLGISTDELKVSGRGFSFLETEPLDMRFSTEQELTAAAIVNQWPERDIADTIYQFGEERYSRRIAKGIVATRKQKRIMTTTDLVEIIQHAVPPGYRHSRIHCATRTFQALRIAVNDELGNLSFSLESAVELCAEGGRIVVISFHSLEDRIVKLFFRRMTVEGRGKLITKRPLTPGPDEISINKAARSAKLRAWEKQS
jgi:16S rRNA (cytosine1402-N4)-methyltransferase